MIFFKKENVNNVHRAIAFFSLGVFALAPLADISANSQFSNKAVVSFQSCTDAPISGFATLKERASTEGVKEVDVFMQVNGLDGKRAVHIHETASCEPCGSAGGHFDPGKAGLTNPDANHPFHSGDLINIKSNHGLGIMTTRSSRVTLSDGPLSVFDSDGSAIIIHDNEDTYCQGGEVAGCAGGSRAACGIVKPVNTIDDFELHVSTSSSRNYAAELANTELSGKAYVFLSPEYPSTPIETVTFFIDGKKRKVEYRVPFDLSGTSRDNHGGSLDTRDLQDGTHTISAVIQMSSGERTFVSSEFSVDNNKRRFGNGSESASDEHGDDSRVGNKRHHHRH